MFVPFIIFSFYFVYNDKNLKYSITSILKYLAVYIFLLSPWWIHNYYKYDTFVRTNLAMGQILYIGNNPLNKSGGGISGKDFSFDNFEINTM